MKAGFLEKRRMEFPTEPSFLEENTGGICKRSPVPGGKPEGIRKRVSFPEKKPKEFTN